MLRPLPPLRPSSAAPVDSPFRRLRKEFDHLPQRLSAGGNGEHGPLTEFNPAFDRAETEATCEILMDLSGINPDDIVVQVAGDQIHISEERQAQPADQGTRFHHAQRCHSSCSQTPRLPVLVAAVKVSARFFRDGLTVTLPKTAASQARTNKVHFTDS
ncbi:MAG: Hsp20/alpha crystallin family protein [Planctomycetes bacterium]|nr:Hsp20/alpha crystallin family protein [Planctomycetota bacterium]